MNVWKPVSTTEKKGYYNFLTILIKYIFFHRIAIYKLAIQIFLLAIATFPQNCEIWTCNCELMFGFEGGADMFSELQAT